MSQLSRVSAERSGSRRAAASDASTTDRSSPTSQPPRAAIVAGNGELAFQLLAPLTDQTRPG